MIWVHQGVCCAGVYGLDSSDHIRPLRTPGRAWPSENLLARGMVMRVRAGDWLMDRYGRRSEIRRLLLTQTEPSAKLSPMHSAGPI